MTQLAPRVHSGTDSLPHPWKYSQGRWLGSPCPRLNVIASYWPPAERPMNSSLSASQLHTVNMRDPLNRVLGEPLPVFPNRGEWVFWVASLLFNAPHLCLLAYVPVLLVPLSRGSQHPTVPLCFSPSPTANLFLLLSSILGARTAGPHTQFARWFLEECVECLEQGGRGSILQFMPFTTVSPAGTGMDGQPPFLALGALGHLPVCPSVLSVCHRCQSW